MRLCLTKRLFIGSVTLIIVRPRPSLFYKRSSCDTVRLYILYLGSLLRYKAEFEIMPAYLSLLGR